ncbi:MAG TPA: c-type cytochrome [Woeseiaceae bacterium]|nr:c-type cytochrome [Woeseiaceae bacterium]
MNARVRCFALCAVAPVLAAGCAGVQSALAPSGAEAERIGLLFQAVTIFCALVFAGVIAAIAVALLGRRSWREKLSGEALVIRAGIFFPVTALSVLLGYGLYVMSLGSNAQAGSGLRLSTDADAPLEHPPGSGLRIAVTGERWWWRVEYVTPDGRRFASANELRLPVGEPVAVELMSDNVIHSFWAPRLAGKLDMIPGRVNTLTLTATEAGVSRGQCAEYCGGAHALMAFYVVAMPPEEFSAWLARASGPAVMPDERPAIDGQALFMTYGCGGCHTVRGTAARGTIGPDLTHVGSRLSLGAGILPNDAQAFARWIRDNQHVKPENLMPPFEIFDHAQLADLAAYLDHLE